MNTLFFKMTDISRRDPEIYFMTDLRAAILEHVLKHRSLPDKIVIPVDLFKAVVHCFDDFTKVYGIELKWSDQGEPLEQLERE